MQITPSIKQHRRPFGYFIMNKTKVPHEIEVAEFLKPLSRYKYLAEYAKELRAYNPQVIFGKLMDIFIKGKKTQNYLKIKKASAALTLLNYLGFSVECLSFSDAKLPEADLSFADIQGVNFSGADCQNTFFIGSFMSACCFTNTDLQGSNFSTIRTKHQICLQKVNQAALGQCGKKLALGYNDGKIQIFETKEFHCIGQMRNGYQNINALEWSPDSRMLATSGIDSPIKVFDSSSFELIHQIKLDSKKFAYKLDWSLDSTKIFYVDQYEILKVHCLEKKESVWNQKKLPGRTNILRCIGRTTSSQIVYNTAETVNLYDFDTRREHEVLVKDTPLGRDMGTFQIMEANLSPDKSLVAVSIRRGILVFAIKEGGILELKYTFKTSSVHSQFHWSSCGNKMFVQQQIGHDHKISPYEITSGSKNESDSILLPQGLDNDYKTCISPDNQKLISLGRPSHFGVSCMKSNKKLADPKLHLQNVETACWSPDATRFATLAKDSSLFIWNAKAFDCAYTFPESSTQRTSVQWSMKGKYLAVAEGGNIMIYKGDNYKLQYTLKSDQRQVTSIAFSKNGKMLAVGGSSSKIEVWRLKNWKKSMTLSVKQQRFNEFISHIEWDEETRYLVGQIKDRILNDNTQKKLLFCVNVGKQQLMARKQIKFDITPQIVLSKKLRNALILNKDYSFSLLKIPKEYSEILGRRECIPRLEFFADSEIFSGSIIEKKPFQQK